ncbi:L,D-transpeptidase family protein [Salinarimonas ramus]|uniref:L,D-TPase catalytic domain-containing protein n=1 Tax=Salinarimonas ramus TaxID=690164 RepID=A0A917Q5G2_9HYPH|nr:L,D-transpeptidase family protein [Salinarimonas ramus]GGK26290.1 hypothetical protein GCM10011322_10850 [Salinarimonas ramus]
MGTGVIDRIVVRRAPGSRHRGWVVAGPLVLPCALGSTGITHDKREGDGATPAGTFRILGALWRADRGPRPALALPLSTIGPRDGWCDAPRDRNYNRPVRLPYPASAEEMRRADGLYDYVLDLSANRGPIRKGRGSAIFLHVAKPGFSATQGCVALEKAALRRLLPLIGRRTRVVVIG